MTSSSPADPRRGAGLRAGRTAVSGGSVVVPFAALAVVTIAAWAVLLELDTMAAEPVAFVGAWAVMMTAMMLPSAAPLVLLYPQDGRARLVAAYLAVWTTLGIPVYLLAAAVDLMDMPATAVAPVLAAAGLYQFTPLKDVCLRTCRSPLDFLTLRWGRGPLLLGAEHALYCVGCCWGLMAVLVVAAAMSVAAAALIASLVFAEKVLPAGEWIARAGGVVLLALAAVIIVV